jgi:Na+/H+ antiporter NhaD/arsenite permease-like protein
MRVILTFLLTIFPILAKAAEGGTRLYTSAGLWGPAAIGIFVLAYALVIAEEKTHIKKSIPVVLAAGLIWFSVAMVYQSQGNKTALKDSFSHAFLEYGMLFMFLMVAMTFVNTLQERNLFEAMRYQLLLKGFSRRTIFWITGLAAFTLSPILDNLTTALVMCSVAMAIAGTDRKFLAVCCISIVVGANAGGAFSPFGDITTLMVWQAGKVEFGEFFSLFFPALVNWLVPALLMSLSISNDRNNTAENPPVTLKKGAWVMTGIFALTIVISVTMFQVFDMPSVFGMMFGLGLLKAYSHTLSKHEATWRRDPDMSMFPVIEPTAVLEHFKPRQKAFDIFISIKRVEWETLLFFYGIIMSVAGLSELGYLAALSDLSYGQLGPTMTNVIVGLISALIDNIPVMYAILKMSPLMSHNEWLLVTLTAGVGGSLISIGSAAGVALSGFAKIKTSSGTVQAYTFASHLKWTPAIFLGYVLSILTHLWLHDMDMTPLFQFF